MKLLIILLILLAVMALIAFRYRKQIQTALYVWRMFRQMRQFNKPQAAQPKEKQIDKNEKSSNAPLVRCGGCGKWTNETAMLKLGSKSFYCSANCMEKAVR
ncbi:MAG TPA: hypothetical protein VGD05_10655 [Pyrinomonadaceae bacterium]|jgi:hypothetical protein|nr:hypothetical protein [Acidobacteriota bacterium]